jgi:hypothetical protein
VNRHDRKLWAQARTLADLGELTAQWLECRINSQPAYAPGCGPDPETGELIPVLAAANRAGFLTDCSQPGHPVDCGGWEQRAAVSGFADAATWVRIWEATEGLPLMRGAERATRFRVNYRTSLPVTRNCHGTCTHFGAIVPRRHLSDSWTGYGECHPDGVKAVCEAWQITLVDHEWGRERSPLWAALAEFAGMVLAS